MHQLPYIFVVDDNPDAAALLVDLLNMASYKSKTFYSGIELLEVLQLPSGTSGNRLPDLILLDLMMPGMDGLEVIRRIKSNPDLPFIPIIMITASGESQDRIAGLQTGADDYLTKPINRAELIARVRSLLRLKRAYDEQTRLLHEVKAAYDRLNAVHLSLAEAEKKKGQMEAMVSTAAAICHEMSQPLTSALITLQLIKQTSEEDVTSTEDFDAVETSLLQARVILDKLRALTRYETKTYLGDEHILDLDLSSSLINSSDEDGPALREINWNNRMVNDDDDLIG
ncbi:MAG: response regulator [Chloroflexota bacterium]|nr:response regulator [Chloroflexota bacterium]